MIKVYNTRYTRYTISVKVSGRTKYIDFTTKYKSHTGKLIGVYKTDNEEIQKQIESRSDFGDYKTGGIWLVETIHDKKDKEVSVDEKPVEVLEVKTISDVIAMLSKEPYNVKPITINTATKALKKAKEFNLEFPNLEQ